MLGLTRGSFSRESPQGRIAQGTLDTGGHPEGPGRHLSWELKAGEEIGSEGEGCFSGTKESHLQRHLRRHLREKGPRAAKGRWHAELRQETEERVAKQQFLQCGPGWAVGGARHHGSCREGSCMVRCLSHKGQPYKGWRGDPLQAVTLA